MADRSDRLAILRNTLDELPRLLAGGGAPASDEQGGEGWTLPQVVAHLADAELVYAVRLRMLVAGEDPPIVAYDEKDWMDRFGSIDTLDAAIARWRGVRESNLRLLESLTEAEWERTGVHPRRGRESVDQQLTRMADHDEGHLRQLQALRA